MMVFKSIALKMNQRLKSIGKLTPVSIALFFFLLLSGGLGSSVSAENGEDEGGGVLIKGFEFFRPYKMPESEEMSALKGRRKQIADMMNAEQERLEKAPERTQENIQAHIKFLENSLKQIEKDIDKEGGPIITTAALHEVVAEFKDKELTLDDMNSVADKVTLAYQDRGYILARAYVPEQEIEDGILKIAIIEGDVGDIKVSGQKYYSERVIRRSFNEQLKHGVIREGLLEEGLLLNKELPSAETRIVLEAGEKPGTANLALHTEDRIAFDWSIDYNNYGTELVGKDRYGTKIEITDPWWGNTLALRGVTGNDPNDSSLTTFDLTIPTGFTPASFNLRYIDGSYIVGQELADLGIEGSTQIYGLSLLYPILRTRNQNMTFSAGFDNKYTESYLQEKVANIDDLNVYHLNLDYDSLDRFLGKNLASFGYYFGRLNPDSAAPFTRANADYRFHHYNINLARIQKIYGNINAVVRGSAQKSNDNLLPIEEMAIGGYGTVRGHETSLFFGDSGYSCSVEFLSAPPYIADKVLFGQRIAQMVQFAAFYDYGRVYYTDPEPGEYTAERLGGYGGGIRLYYKDLFNFKFDIGFPTRNKADNEDSKFLYFSTNINFMSKELKPSLKKIGNWITGGTEEEASAP